MRKVRQTAILVVLLAALMSCSRRQVVTESGELDTSWQAAAALALDDFSTAFVAFGDAVVAEGEAGAIPDSVAASITRANIAISENIRAVNTAIERSDSDSVIDEILSVQQSLEDLPALPDSLNALMQTLRGYTTLIVSVVRLKVGG